MAGPRPKMRSDRSLLQTGAKPRKTNLVNDPDAAIFNVPIVRTIVGDRAGAVPSEAYQYDLVYECFANDKDFQRYWKVPPGGFARCSSSESISQKNSYIRVVMDLDKECKLYPTAYTPGFPTVPREISDSDLQRNNAMSMSIQKIPGLPEGYSVALDVYIYTDAAILLKHQRAFRGRVDAAYRWLDTIINPNVCEEELVSDELALVSVTPMDNSILQKPLPAMASNMSAGPLLDSTEPGAPKNWTWHSIHGTTPPPDSSSGALALQNGGYNAARINPNAFQSLNEVIQPAAREALPLSCLNACPRGLGVDPQLDEAGKSLQDFRREIHTENALINAFGGHVGLPQRDTGTLWGNKEDAGALERKQAYAEETERLDRQLERLWVRTVDQVVPGETTI